MPKYLSSITDDPRISVDNSEYIRIARDIRFFKNDFPQIKYINSLKQIKKRYPFTLNMTKKVSRRLASIIFNEKCSIEIGSKANRDGNSNQALEKTASNVNDFIQRVLEDNDFGNVYEEALECAIATGSMAQRPYVDAQGNIKIAFARADQIFPLESNTTHVRQICIASRTVKSESGTNTYYTLLEFHQWDGDNYVITNELYKSSDETAVGEQVPLSTLYPNMQQQTQVSGIKYPLFAFFKTAGANNKSLESPLGVGIVDNSLDTLKAINDVYDAFHWEIKNGRRRVIVPDEMVRFDDAHKPTFDSDTDVYLSNSADADDFRPTDITHDMRIDQFTSALSSYLRTLEMEIGLSNGTFAYDSGSGTITATQVVSENSSTYQTRSSFLTMVEHDIIDLVRSIVEIATIPELFPGESPLSGQQVDIDDLDINVHFDDGVFTDRKTQADYMIELKNGGLIPTWYAIMKTMDISEDQAREWANEIASETGQGMNDTPAGTEQNQLVDPLSGQSGSEQPDEFGFTPGDVITVNADHMPGMKGATGVIDSAPAGTPAGVYMIDYQPTDGSAIVKNHKWVTADEIETAPAGTTFPGSKQPNNDMNM